MKFIESILYSDGFYNNLNYHQARMNHSFKKLGLSVQKHNLEKVLPKLPLSGTYKVRLLYDENTYDVEYAEYLPRNIQSLEVVQSAKFDYSSKYEDRSKITELTDKSNADDIIIAIDDHITDGSYFNLAFWDGQSWVTPNTPLLKGVRRTQLIDQGRLSEQEICISDLQAFEKVSLINAMLDLEQLEINMNQIKF